MAASEKIALFGTYMLKFEATTGRDTMMKGGVSTTISTRHQCITVMKMYENKSLQELRMEDYILQGKIRAKGANPTDAILQKGGEFALNPTNVFSLSNCTTVPQHSASALISNPTKTFQFGNTTSAHIFSHRYRLIRKNVVRSQNPTTTTHTFSNSIETTSSSTTAACTFTNPTSTALASPNSSNTTFGFPNLSFTFSKPTPAPFTFSADNLGTVPKKETKHLESNIQKDLQKIDPPLCIDASTQTRQEIYVNKLLQGLKEMLLNSKHSDFILNVKGKEFRVHKIILEAHSPVFAAMMEHDTKEKATGIANVDDCEPSTITLFLNFLYTGRVENLNSDNVLNLYVVADKYQVIELSKLCIEYMKNNISIENFCDIMSLSLRHHVMELTTVATDFFCENSSAIAVTTKWQTFLVENPVAGNELFLKVLSLKKD